MSLRSLRRIAMPAVLAALTFPALSAGQTAPADPALPEAALPGTSESASTLPAVDAPELIDVPGDDGTRLGLLWRWQGETATSAKAAVQVLGNPAWLDKYRLTDSERQRLDDAAAWLAGPLSELLPKYEAAEAALAEAENALAAATIARAPDYRDVLVARWQAWRAFEALDIERNKLRDKLRARVGKLIEKEMRYRYLEAALKAAEQNGGWLDTNLAGDAAAIAQPKGAARNRFGLKPAEPDKLYAELEELSLPAPPDAAVGSYDRLDQQVLPGISLPLEANNVYQVRLLLSDGAASAETPFGQAAPQVNYFLNTRANNAIFAFGFAIIILSAIAIARRNSSLFIRRIAGLEAVDEAIGRATEMGKPVLYINGMTTLADLATLAAVNILGRVARKIADYDSALIVPCRDPVVLSVAQEVAREAFIDAGRPDAYREDNIFFVTEDQFSYTASTCAIMLRERPAANFFMGYYYAESLLLAETGASTGAIQIAGTDSQSQLPFFITACDYTLIGEELYAASAYLSREPLLLGSLKGQDLAKALVMLVILLQTILFFINKDFDWIKVLVTAL